MTLSYTNRGTAENSVASTTFAVSPTTDCTVGALVLLAVAYDNAVVGGGDPFSTITDSHGNTWTPRVDVLYDPLTENSGLVVRLFECYQDISRIHTTDTITVTFSTSTTAKAATISDLAGSAGVPTYSASNSTSGASATHTITTDSLTTGSFVIGITGVEHNSAITADSDATNGNWSTQQYITTSLGAASNAEISTQGKVVTGSGTQTYNTSTALARDYIIAWASYTEVPKSMAVSSGPSIPMPIMCM